MKTKTLFLAVVALMAICNTGFAQRKPQQNRGSKEEMQEKHAQMQEKMRAEKIAFLTSELSLGSEEAEQFFAVYNPVDEKRQRAQGKLMKMNHMISKAAKSENTDCEKILDLYAEALAERNAADAEAVAVFRKEFGDETTAKLLAAEERFMKFQLFKLKGGPDQGRNGQGGPEHRGPRGGMNPFGGNRGGADFMDD